MIRMYLLYGEENETNIYEGIIMESYSEGNMDIVKNLYQEYIGKDFPKCRIEYKGMGEYIVQLNKSPKILRKEMISDILKIYHQKNDKRVYNLQISLRQIIRLMKRGYIFLND